MAETWQVIVSREPKKILAKVPADLRRRLLTALHSLAEDPRPAGCKKLQGYDNLYRVRVGDWRISYAVEDDKLIVVVLEIAPRGGAYKGIDR
jgi:mRNA interferase RelE/StbE